MGRWNARREERRARSVRIPRQSKFQMVLLSAMAFSEATEIRKKPSADALPRVVLYLFLLFLTR